jgi:hypothetical protein
MVVPIEKEKAQQRYLNRCVLLRKSPFYVILLQRIDDIISKFEKGVIFSNLD